MFETMKYVAMFLAAMVAASVFAVIISTGLTVFGLAGSVGTGIKYMFIIGGIVFAGWGLLGIVETAKAFRNK